MAEFFRPGDQGAVPGDLVVLHSLAGSGDRGFENLLVVDFTGDMVGFLDGPQAS